ncbi:MAG TPA: SUMF1/EgtB/PvdO family nonheme iron enzyme [Candidatus Sabulitectum sp.]|nr:SUMF1/EgtB/PvdO family nonheme iron enzyme [Candidatus Sabulitectum sp.]
MRFLPILLLLAAVPMLAWECPRCLSGNPDDAGYCSSCLLPLPPEGMTFIPGTTVEIEGEEFEVKGFFIDDTQVTYREFLPWLNGSGFGARELGAVITGGSTAESMEFLAFTPFMGDQAGGITVPSQCLENAVASITWSGAQSYLSSEGKRLPTLAELHAANRAGLVQELDAYQAMSDFSGQMRASLGDMLGTLATQAMFAGYSTARERVMWELTGTEYGEDPTDTAPAPGVIFVSIFKPGETPELSAVNRDEGYFNVVFRGAIEVPE